MSASAHAPNGPYTLVLLRHGESVWNKKNLFTGWVDVDLTDKGVAEASSSGTLMREAGVLPDVVHTSLQRRAIRTVNLALETADRVWIPVRRSWRLNERHYGGLTGLDKAETSKRHGEEQVHIWRRSYTTPPPAIAPDQEHNPNSDAQYADLPAELIPESECLADVFERVLPYWYDDIVPDLQAQRVVLVGAHGNSLRALVKHIESIGDDEITSLNIPTGVPLVYELDEAMQPIRSPEAKGQLSGRYLDPEAADAGAAASAAQASGG